MFDVKQVVQLCGKMYTHCPVLYCAASDVWVDEPTKNGSEGVFIIECFINDFFFIRDYYLLDDYSGLGDVWNYWQFAVIYNPENV